MIVVGLPILYMRGLVEIDNKFHLCEGYFMEHEIVNLRNELLLAKLTIDFYWNEIKKLREVVVRTNSILGDVGNNIKVFSDSLEIPWHKLPPDAKYIYWLMTEVWGWHWSKAEPNYIKDGWNRVYYGWNYHRDDGYCHNENDGPHDYVSDGLIPVWTGDPEYSKMKRPF